MHIENVKETFSEIFHYTLNNRSNSRPPKIELRGVLVPCDEILYGRHFAYKLETDSDEYLLMMAEPLISVARKAEWEEVYVKGVIDFEQNTFEVEKISLARLSEPFVSGVGWPVSSFDESLYKKMIEQHGTLEPAADYLAS